nr:dmX protein 1 [Hymenolepis microstoma]
MRLHQVITGSRNSGRNCLASLNFAQSFYLIYGCGRNVVILDKNLFKIQVIADAIGSDPGEVVCLSCEDLSGLMAVSNGKDIVIFEPILSKISWRELCKFSPGGFISALGWFPHSSKCQSPFLAIGSSRNNSDHHISCWRLNWPVNDASDICQQLWIFGNPEPVNCLSVSPDGRFIASLASLSSELRVWYPIGRFSSSRQTDENQSNWLPCILRHPDSVVSFSWRSMPRYLPPGWLPNALLTSCKDGVARVWFEDALGTHRNFPIRDNHSPDRRVSANLVNENSNEKGPLSAILFEHPVLNFYFRLWSSIPHNQMNKLSIPDYFPSDHMVYSSSYPVESSRFLMATSISIRNDLSVVFNSNPSDNLLDNSLYVLQWMNNKTKDFELKLSRFLRRIIYLVTSVPIGDSITEHTVERLRSILGIFDQMLLKCLSKWRKSQDTLLMLHPSDGSLCIWVMNGLDSCSLNHSVLSSNTHKICDESVQPEGGHSSRVKKNVQLDLTQHQRVCQATCTLRSLLPDTGSTYVTCLTKHDPILFSRVYESGFEANDQLHLLLVKCILLRSKLALAVGSNLKGYLRGRLISEIRLIQLDSMSPPNPCGQLMLSMYSVGIGESRGSIKHQAVGCNSLIQNSGLFNVTSTTSEAVRQANGHSESVMLFLHHPLLPLVLILSPSEFSLWHIPLCSPSPLSAHFSPPLRKFGQFTNHNESKFLRSAAFFPCIITPPIIPTSNTKMLQLPISIVAIESSSDVRLFCMDTTGVIRASDKLPEAVSLENETTSLLFVIQSPSFLIDSMSSTFLVIRALSIKQTNGITVCRIEIWRVELNPDRLINGKPHGFESLVIRQRPNAPIVGSIVKISDEFLPTEPGVSVQCVKRGPSPISWSNETLQPAYLMAMSCSDGGVRFWTIEPATSNGKTSSSSVSCIGVHWVEWQHPYTESVSTRIHIPLDLLKKRLLDAELDDVTRSQLSLSPQHRRASSITPSTLREFQSAEVVTLACSTNCRVAIACIADPMSPLLIAIYECESSGGSEWLLEDIITPSTALRPYDMSSVELHSIQLDWVKTEDGGSMLLSFACGQSLYISAARCMDMVRRTLKIETEKPDTLLHTLGEVGLRWCRLRCVELRVDDSKSPVSPLVWLPNGLLMFHHNSNIYLFSQWSSSKDDCTSSLIPTRLFEQDSSGDGFVSVEASRLSEIYCNLNFTKRLSKQEIATRSCLKKYRRAVNPLKKSFYDNLGLFEAAQLSNPTLPQFHPQQLLEWMNLGRFRLVQATLVHLMRSLLSQAIHSREEALPKFLRKEEGEELEEMEKVEKRQRECEVKGEHKQQNSVVVMEENRTETYEKENKPFPNMVLPPLPLYILDALDALKIDKFKAHKNEIEGLLTQDSAVFLDETDPKFCLKKWESSLEELGYLSNGVPANPHWDPKDRYALSSLLQFGEIEGQFLTFLLSRYHLPGLSKLDQIYLRGIVELMSNTEKDVTERLSGLGADFQDSDKSSLLDVDDCGLRFIMSMKLYDYLCKNLPPEECSKLLEYGMTSRSFAWAFHSKSEEMLFSRLPSQRDRNGGSNLTWEEFRRYGCTWWIHSDDLLLLCAEKMARAAFAANNDPMSAALFYLSMNKPSILASLYRTQGIRARETFFRSDFTSGSPACRQAKMNAFRLLSQHKYPEAAALFIIGDWLEDAIRVCIYTLKDLQLAVFVCRLYSLSHGTREGEESAYHQILRSHVICHEDPYLRSIGYWTLSEPLNALTTLIMKPAEKPEDNTALFKSYPSMTKFPHYFEIEICPSVFRLYTFLRLHPLVIENLRSENKKEAVNKVYNKLALLDRRLYFRTAYHYNTIGCPTLALAVLRELPQLKISNPASNNHNREADDIMMLIFSDSKTCMRLEEVDGVKPPVLPTPAEEEVTFSFFNTSPLDAMKYLDMTEFKLSFSDDENDNDWKESKLNGNGVEYEEVNPLLNGNIEIENVVTTGGIAIQSQIKYLACLRIFTEELSSTFLTFSSEGNDLKRLLYTWLNNEILQLEKISSPYDETPSSEGSDIDQPRPSCPLIFDYDDIDRSLLIPINFKGPGHAGGFSIASNQKQEPTEDENNFSLRLANNLELVQSLVIFCCLHGESGVNLRVIRMELTHLLMDIYNSISGDIDYSPRGYLIRSLSLFRNSYLNAPIISPPLDLIKTMINDISSCILELPPPYTKFILNTPLSFLAFDGKVERQFSADEDPGASVSHRIALLRNLCIALSTCVFQSLSTASWRTTLVQGNAGLAIVIDQSNALTAEHFVKFGKSFLPNSEPSEWPGVPGLFASKDDSSASLSSSVSSQQIVKGVLAEALVAVYTGLCVCALYIRDASVLYRLVKNASLGDPSIWSRVFGGVCRLKPLRPPPPLRTAVCTPRRPSPSPPPRPTLPSVVQTSQQQPVVSGPNLQVNQASSTTQTINDKLSQSPTTTHVHEIFLPPQCSIATCFLEKISHSAKSSPLNQEGFDYDSDDDFRVTASYESYSDGVNHLVQSARSLRNIISPAISSKKLSDKFEPTDFFEENSLIPPGQSIVLQSGCDLKITRLPPDLGNIEFSEAAVNALGNKNEAEELDLLHSKEDFKASDKEWFNGDSFSWRLMRLAFTQLMQQQIGALVKLLNVDNEFLISYAPTLLQTRGLLEKWVEGYREALEVSSDTEDRIAIDILSAGFVAIGGLYYGEQDQADANLSESARRAVAKLAYIMKPENSPFKTRNPLSLPVKRLWFSLLSRHELNETFLRWIFHPKQREQPSLQPIKLEVVNNHKTSIQSVVSISTQPEKKLSLPSDQGFKLPKENEISSERTIGMRSDGILKHKSSINLIHWEQDPILCMCVDKFNYDAVALATPREIIEVSISNLLSPADWMFDDFEYDLDVMRNPVLKNREGQSVNDFLLYEKPGFNLRDQVDSPIQGPRGINSSNLIIKRTVGGVEKLSSHPLMNFYLCGTNSGYVHALQWGVMEPVVHMLANTYSLTDKGHTQKITSTTKGSPISVLHLDSFGKRFGCGDTAGYFGLWNVDFTGSHSYPYFSCRCHNKGVLDFAFIDGGSTKFVTVGTGSISTYPNPGVNMPTANAVAAANRPGLKVTSQFDLEAANVVIWDSMEPLKSAAVITFSESPLDAACTCVTTVPSGSFGHQIAVGTKRGEVAIIDLRSKNAVTAYNPTAHAGSALRSIICDSATDTLTTASADNRVKVWRLSDPCQLLSTFQAEESNSSVSTKAAQAFLRGNQSAAMIVASRPGISQLSSLPSASTVVECKCGEAREKLHLLTSRFLACGVDGRLQMCSVTPSPEPLWLPRC